MNLTIEKSRATLTGKLDKRLLQLSPSLEGMKRWLKTGGYSFEATPMNLERFTALFPDVPIVDNRAQGSSLFDEATAATPVARGAYVPKTPPFPFQFHALAVSGHGIGSIPTARPTAPPVIVPDIGSGAPPPQLLASIPGRVLPIPEPSKLGWKPSTPAPFFALFGEMGTGKSKILIDMMGQLWCAGKIDAVLIISPKGVHEQWVEEQIPAHMGEMVPWKGIAIDTKKKIPDWPDGKLAILSVNVDYPRLKQGFANCEAFIKKFNGRVLIIVDESHKIKTKTTSRTEAIIALGQMCAYRRIATGTPISRDLTDAFSQFYFLDPRVFGQEYITSFRAEYCIMGGFEGESVVGHKNVEQFYARIAPYTFRITKEEADLGIPEKMPPVRFPFEMSPEQKSHYLEMKEDMITKMDTGQIVTVSNAVSQLVRLQQIACGYLVWGGDKEKKIKPNVRFLKNARIDALEEVIASREGKMVIWCRYNEDVHAIKRLLGDKAVTYHGATSDSDREIAKRRFLDINDPIRFFVANPAAGGTGLNLQGECRTVIYYSNSFNAIDRWQSEDRVHRIGAKHQITYIDLIARGTIDTRILNNLRDKKSISDLAFDDIRKMLDE